MKFTVYQVNPNTHARIRALYTGHYSETLTAIKYLIDKQKWSVRNLGLMDETTGRWSSFDLDAK